MFYKRFRTESGSPAHDYAGIPKESESVYIIRSAVPLEGHRSCRSALKPAMPTVIVAGGMENMRSGTLYLLQSQIMVTGWEALQNGKRRDS